MLEHLDIQRYSLTCQWLSNRLLGDQLLKVLPDLVQHRDHGITIHHIRLLHGRRLLLPHIDIIVELDIVNLTCC